MDGWRERKFCRPQFGSLYVESSELVEEKSRGGRCGGGCTPEEREYGEEGMGDGLCKEVTCVCNSLGLFYGGE